MSLAARLGLLALALLGCRAPGPSTEPATVPLSAPPPTPPPPSAPTLVAAAPVPMPEPYTVPALPPPGPGPAVPLVRPTPELFTRGQTWLAGVRPWDGALVAVGDGRGGDGSSWIGPLDPPERAHAVPLAVPGAERVVDVATYAGTPVALVKTAGGLALAFHRGPSWSIEPVPAPARARDDVLLAAGPGALVLLHPGRLHVLRAGSWKSLPIGALNDKEELGGKGQRHLLALPDRLLLGVAAGEWGGALLGFDFVTGARTRYPEREPVTDLVAGPDGAAWAATGLTHMGTVQGSLHRLDGATWAVVAKVDGSDTVTGKQVVGAHVAWDLPLASFDAVAFDEQGRLHVLTGQLGVVRRDPDRWTRLTPGWPGFVYTTGLAVRGSLLAIATFDAGLILWDTSTGKARRVALGP